ncbi:MAG TPA: zinc ribbon domain-containing protein [Actinomycetota bacterium]|nr:zinc ribbon domain-containing protein [Actinomycetota bacterium]
MSQVTRYCPSCGLERREGERFCRNCGAPLGTGQTSLHASPPVAPQPAPIPPALDQRPDLIAPVPAPASSLPAPPTASVAVRPALGTAVPLRPFALASGALLVIASLLPWISIEGVPSVNALDVPVQALWDLNAADGPIEVGFVLIALGLLGGGLSLLPRTAWIRRLCGSITLAVVAMFVLQLFRSVDQSGGSVGDFVSSIGIGVYAATAAAVGLQVSR